MIKKISSYLLVGCLLITLAGCGTKVDSSLVLSQMANAMSQVKQCEFAGSLNLFGEAASTAVGDLKDLKLIFNGKANLSDPANFIYLANVDVNGTGTEGATRVSAEVRSFTDYNYFRITDLSMPLGLPFALTTDNRWYQVHKSTMVNDLGMDTEKLTVDEVAKVREAIKDSYIFNIQQVLPDATVNSMRTYHLSVTLDSAGVNDLAEKLSLASNKKISFSADNLKLAEGYNYELWISQRDYQLTKLQIAGSYADKFGQTVSFEANVNLTGFDKSVEISRPTTANDFQLSNLFGLPIGKF